MGKRELVKKERNPRDLYPTIDPAAVDALAPFLASGVRYIEPCAGGGHLIDLLSPRDLHTRCVGAYDIEPQRADVVQRSCLSLTDKDTVGVDCFITNPPFQWDMLHPILDHLPTLLPTWLLLPADVAHNRRMVPYMNRCSKMVSVGRLYWFLNDNGKAIKGVDNFVWLLLTDDRQQTVFYNRG